MFRLMDCITGVLAIIGLMTVAAYAPAATPVAAKPALSPTAKPSPKPDWKVEWDRTVAAAKKEGKVVVSGGPGSNYRNAVMKFQDAFPGIKIEFTGMSGGDFGPKMLAERKAGRFLWDISVAGSTMSLALKPNGVLDPLRPSLMLPEVLDDSKWAGGFEDSWVDNDGQYVFQIVGTLTFIALVNRKVVSESELNSVDQLIDPKWKGKIVAQDPRMIGKTSVDVAHLLMVKGEAWVRKLLANDLVIINNERQRTEALIRGRFPIGMGLSATQLLEFEAAGVIDHVKPLAPDTVDGARQSNSFGNVVLINRAPHPNAAKVFINWLLSRKGQESWVEATAINSRRVDVKGPADTALKPNIKYQNVNLEKNEKYFQRAVEIAKEIIK